MQRSRQVAQPVCTATGLSGIDPTINGMIPDYMSESASATPSSADPWSDSVSALATQCAEHNAQYRHQRPALNGTTPLFNNAQACFTLFYLALAKADQEAWEVIVREYRAQVADWIRHHPAFNQLNELPEALINGAFTRLWKYASLHVVNGRFNTLGQCLQYLKMCAWTEVQNALRQGAARQRETPLFDEDDVDEDAPPGHRQLLQELNQRVLEQATEEAQSRELRGKLDQLGMLLNQIVQTDQERLVAEEAWTLGLPPRDIYTRHADQFADVHAVHQTVRNIIRRLQRHPKIQELAD